ncbi:HK97 gp10 family phage protein [Bradyrhizobium sp. Leo121]|uniref:HK97 gp10 family phage protein n=1 Tax=Bradyrhizobium sp. Leo121 TaxID=1571195 RepID=UPI00102A419E|nr:HK97 gp10 family phage protein [Bradyrhizobium sp. Leo121]RZN24777.1 hypothetical protein CWO90_28475 [Bradyrhizobium sp. Leo121]
MAINVRIDSADLVKFMQNTEKAPQNIKGIAARALNKLGDQLLDDVVEVVAAQTGMDDRVLRRDIVVTRASPGNLYYSIDASAALIEAPATRPMPGARRFNRRPDDYFHAEELVNIVTMGDEEVCKICEALEEGGPYTIEEARTLLPAHPHCRCVVQPYRSRRELPVAFRKGQSVELASATLERLRERLRNEIKFSLRVL